MVLSCTLEGLELFEPIPSKDQSKYLDMTTTRRMLDDREFVFGTYPLDSDEFINIFTDFFPETICRGGVPTDAFKAEFHRLSVGIPAIINRLAKLHHEQVIITKKKTDDIAILNQVYKTQFRHIDFALEQLRMVEQTDSPNESQLKIMRKLYPEIIRVTLFGRIRKRMILINLLSYIKFLIFRSMVGRKIITAILLMTTILKVGFNHV